jgi:hypothetical protein
MVFKKIGDFFLVFKKIPKKWKTNCQSSWNHKIKLKIDFWNIIKNSKLRLLFKGLFKWIFLGFFYTK